MAIYKRLGQNHDCILLNPNQHTNTTNDIQKRVDHINDKNVVLFIQTNPKLRLSTQKTPHKHIELHHINDKTVKI